jgi:membrane-associated phospholipid phosphatase
MPADGAAPSVGTIAARPVAAVAAPSEASAKLRGPLAFLTLATPFFAAAAVYEVLRRLIVVYRGDVHTGDLFLLEERLFPVSTAAGTQALSQVIAANVHPVLDFICGTTYLVFLAELFGIAGYMFFRSRVKMLELALAFLTANILGWSIWMLYPAAPPWYIDLHGMGPAILDTPSNPAGLSRIDALLPFPVAATFYAKSANVFGAMPSLHCAYATFVAAIVYPLGGKLRWGTIAFAVSMVFSAVYLRHHYILDVIAGIALAVPVVVFVRFAAPRLMRLARVAA